VNQCGRPKSKIFCVLDVTDVDTIRTSMEGERVSSNWMKLDKGRSEKNVFGRMSLMDDPL